MTDTKIARYWQAKLDDLGRTELDTVRSTAAKWQGTISALLGIFGTVAFVSGNQTIEKLSPSAAAAAKLGVTVAVVLAVGAVLSATYAAQGIPRQREAPDWIWLATQLRKQAGRGLVALRCSQILALAAVLVVVAGSLLVLWNSESKTAAQPASVLMRLANGSVVCGSVVSQRGILALRMTDGTIMHFDAMTQPIGEVSTCPR